MHLGRIVQTGTGVEVVNRPVDEFVAAFVGMETSFRARSAESRQGLCPVAVGGAQVQCVGGPQPGTRSWLGSARKTSLSPDHAGAGHSARNHFPATVTRIVPRGPFFKVELDCGFFLAAFVTPGSLEELALAPGRAVVASFKATAVHLITRG